MTLIGWIQIILFCAIVVALAKPLGWYMTCVFNGERTLLSPCFVRWTVMYRPAASTRA